MAENKSKYKFNPPTGDVIHSILKQGDRLVDDGELNQDYLQEIHRVDSRTTVIVSKLQKTPTFIERIMNGPTLQLEVQVEEEMDNLVSRTKYLVFKRSKKKYTLKSQTLLIDDTIVPDAFPSKVKHNRSTRKDQRKIKKLLRETNDVSNDEAIRLSEDLKTVI